MKLLSGISGRNRSRVRNHEHDILPHAGVKMTTVDSSLGNIGRIHNLKSLYSQAHSTMYKCRTASQQIISVQEIMLDTRLSFHIPLQYLIMLINQESKLIVTLRSVKNLANHLELYIKSRENLLEQYNLALRSVTHRERDVFFKPSTLKTEKELEFVPTNLQLQRMRVQQSDFIVDESHCSTSGVVDSARAHNVVTVGAASAHCLKFKNGGLLSLISMASGKVKEDVLSSIMGTDQFSQAVELPANLQLLERDVAWNIDKMRQMLTEGKDTGVIPIRNSMKPCLTALISKTNALLDFLDNKELLTSMPFSHDEASATSSRAEWEGMTGHARMKLAEIVKKICTMLDAADGLLSFWQDAASPSFDEMLSDLRELSMTINNIASLAMQQHSMLVIQSPQEPEEIIYRRDVVFSQVLSSCICGVITTLISSIDDVSQLENYAKHGMLVQWHSLLSTFKNELGMLEDMVVGVFNLRKVVFCCDQVAQRDGNDLDYLLPSLRGTRDKIIVKLPLVSSFFEKLPGLLRSGKTFKVIPVLFNVGINEEQTLADRMGTTSLQENINMKSYHHLLAYCQDMKPSSTEAATIHNWLKKLKGVLHLKKSKNVEIFDLAGEICRMLRGVRVSTCKSGKDRTSMAVTLEQVQILREQHGLRPDAFESTLDLMRRTGTRIHNAEKNVGRPKYAFTGVQLMTFPRFYKPPEGTYNNLPS